jgi:hypothetical protein
MIEYMYWLTISVITLRLSIAIVQPVTKIALARTADRRVIQMRRTEGDVAQFFWMEERFPGADQWNSLPARLVDVSSHLVALSVSRAPPVTNSARTPVDGRLGATVVGIAGGGGGARRISDPTRRLSRRRRVRASPWSGASGYLAGPWAPSPRWARAAVVVCGLVHLQNVLEPPGQGCGWLSDEGRPQPNRLWRPEFRGPAQQSEGARRGVGTVPVYSRSKRGATGSGFPGQSIALCTSNILHGGLIHSRRARKSASAPRSTPIRVADAGRVQRKHQSKALVYTTIAR